jgi:hypothetical protein
MKILIAQSTSSSTALWFTLGGVLVTGAITLTTAIINHRWQREEAERQVVDERVKQLRQERREAYASYWSAYNAYERALAALSKARRFYLLTLK